MFSCVATIVSCFTTVAWLGRAEERQRYLPLIRWQWTAHRHGILPMADNAYGSSALRLRPVAFEKGRADVVRHIGRQRYLPLIRWQRTAHRHGILPTADNAYGSSALRLRPVAFEKGRADVVRHVGRQRYLPLIRWQWTAHRHGILPMADNAYGSSALRLAGGFRER